MKLSNQISFFCHANAAITKIGTNLGEMLNTKKNVGLISRWCYKNSSGSTMFNAKGAKGAKGQTRGGFDSN